MNLRAATRSLWKNPTFTLVALTILVLGIGANTAIFSVVDAVLLRPLPYKNPDRIVALQTLWLQSRTTGQVSLPDFLDWKQQSNSFDVMAFYYDGRNDVFANGIPQRVNAAVAQAQFFNVFGVAPILGRTFTEQDKQQPETPVAVVGQSFFNRNFHGDRQALGKIVKLEQHEFVVVGVMPAGFAFPEESEVWIPDYDFLVSPWGASRTGHNFRVVGLIKPNVSLTQAQAEMTTIGSRLAKAYPNDDAKKSVAVTPLHDELVKKVRTTLYLLLGAVALVLLIACANVANLLLAKVTMRRQEIAIRTALGASHGSIVRPFLAEALALPVPARILGLLLGWWSAQLLAHFSPEMLAQARTVSLDWRVAFFAVAVSLLCTVLFGLAPAYQASDVDVNRALHSGG